MPIRVLHWIRGWRLDKFFIRFYKTISKEAKVIIPAAIAVTNKLKDFIDTPVADIVTAIIPGTLDDTIKEKLKLVLPKVIMKLQLAQVIANIEDVNEQLIEILKILKLSPNDTRNNFYHEFCYTLIEVLSDGKVSMAEASLLANMYYEFEHGNELQNAA